MSNMRKPSAPQASGYSNAGGSLTRRATRSFRPDSNSPSQDINQNSATLRQRSRMLYMSSPIAASAINTNRTKVVGTGLTLKTAIDRDVLGLPPETAKKWQSQTEAEFRLWAENRRNCDALGIDNQQSGTQSVSAVPGESAEGSPEGTPAELTPAEKMAAARQSVKALLHPETNKEGKNNG